MAETGTGALVVSASSAATNGDAPSSLAVTAADSAADAAVTECEPAGSAESVGDGGGAVGMRL